MNVTPTMTKFRAFGVLSVESHRVRFSVMSSKDGSVVSTSVVDIPLMTAASGGRQTDRRPKCADDDVDDDDDQVPLYDDGPWTDDGATTAAVILPVVPNAADDGTVITDGEPTTVSDGAKKVDEPGTESKKGAEESGAGTGPADADKSDIAFPDAIAQTEEDDESKKDDKSGTAGSAAAAADKADTALPDAVTQTENEPMKDDKSGAAGSADASRTDTKSAANREAAGADPRGGGPAGTTREKAPRCELLRVPSMGRGHVEQDPDCIWDAVQRVVGEAVDAMRRDGTPVTYIKSVGVVNEMGTVVAWHAETGAKLHNAIHWTDARMGGGAVAGAGGGVGTAAAVAWLLQRSPAVKCAGRHCRFGTLDAWLTWKLTAGRTYDTDVTNASYTGLLDVATLDWDHDRCRAIGLKDGMWPAVRSRRTDHDVAAIQVGRLVGHSVQLTMARPSAVMYGQRCCRAGLAAVTVAERTAVVVCPCDRKRAVAAAEEPVGGPGPAPVVGYLEPDPLHRAHPRVVYGLMAVSGAPAPVCWLVDDLGLAASAGECLGAYAAAGPPSPAPQDACMVPALAGLPHAPHRRPDARLVFCGIGERTGPRHLMAAAVDAVCHSVADAVACAARGSAAERVLVDGPYAASDAVMQRVADVCGCQTRANRTAADMVECHGVARIMAAGAHADYADPRHVTASFEPKCTAQQRDECRGLWAKAVVRSYGWAGVAGARGRVDDPFAERETPDGAEPRTLYKYLTDELGRVTASVRRFF